MRNNTKRNRLDVRDLLEPYSPDQFLHEIYGKRAALLGEPSDRFADLLAWEQLEFAMMHRRVEGSRVRVLYDGRATPIEEYTRTLPVRRGGAATTIRADVVAELLRKGATLALDDIDEFAEPVADLLPSVERLFREEIAATAYLSGGTKPGFRVHWDPHDTIAVQLVGRKIWRLYGQTQEAPLVRDPTVAGPEGEPQETYELRAGQAIYLPRGWWHGVEAAGEPSLHVTVSIARSTGVDLVAWLAKRLRERAEFRHDLPRLHPDRYDSHMAGLKAVIDELWNADLLRRYLAEDESQAVVRRRLALPDVLPGQDRRLAAGDVVCLLAGRAVLGRRPNGEVMLGMDGKRWVFDESHTPVIELLSGGGEHTVADLTAALAGRSGEEAAQALDDLLHRLLAAGVVRVTRASA